MYLYNTGFWKRFIIVIVKKVVDFFSFKLIRNHFALRYLVISIFCFTVVFVLNGQNQYTRFDHLTVQNGLSSNRIQCIFRDSKGYLWMGTEVGLDKYDSYQIKKYRYDEKRPGSISSNNVRCIYEDRNKNLWFGTADGLNLYDPEKDNFKIFKHNPDSIKNTKENYFTGILEDKKGNLWFVSGGNCLDKWLPENQTLKSYFFDKKNPDFVARQSKMLAIDSKGYIWVVSVGSGLSRFDPEAGTFTKFDDPSINFGSSCYKSLYIDNQDKIWIITDGSGFFSYDPGTGKFEQFGSKGDGKGTNQSRILDFMPENDRYLLLGVDQGGINRFDKISKTFEYFMYDKTNEDGLNTNGIWCFYKDTEGILWIGTSGGGINYYNPKKENFKLFTHNNNPKSLSYNFTGCFFEDYQGLIWVGTDGGGVNVYNPATGNFTVYQHNPSDPHSISGNVIRSIAEDKDHDIWIGTWEAGLNRYDRKTGKFFHYLPDINNPASISGKTTWSLFIDENNIIWLGIYGVGIDLFDKNKGVIRRFRNDPENSESLSSNSCWLFYKDSEKNMWICTENGLDLYNNKTNSFKIFNFSENSIPAFCKDKEGNFWVGTNRSGIYYCRPDGTIIKTYNISNGLSDNKIQAIIEDTRGNIWISTNYGISRFDHNTHEFRNYSKDDGLQGDQFFGQSFLKTRKGEIYFGGYNGFNSFFPDSLKNNDFIPPVYITDFQIFNKSVPFAVPGAQFQTDISEAKEIKLNWNQSVFSFSFSAINYTHPEKNQYSYIMEGFEKEWNNTNASRRYVTYTNLNPGEYTFRVKASNNDGVWNKNGVSLKIIILPPWWKTWWFRLIMVSAIILIFVTILLLRVRSLKNQKILLEKLIVIKTAELQEKNDILIKQAEELSESNILLEERQHLIEMQKEELLSQKEVLVKMNNELNELNVSKDKFFSIIAHDLKNPFNTILGYSEILKDDIKAGNQATIEESVGLVHAAAVQTLRLLENLLEWANSQRGKILFKPVPIKLNELLVEEFSVLIDMATGKNIELKSFLNDDLTIIADRNMIKTVLRNLISNAIKFTHKNGKVEVKAMSENKHIVISVSDNGIGMTKETIAKLFRIDANLTTHGTEDEKGTGLGLFLCKEFVEKHGGRIWVESEAGRGSTFKFLLPEDINLP
jgi:signal transduction histidine kinase/ligand-binding sensor domain-containing protein